MEGNGESVHSDQVELEVFGALVFTCIKINNTVQIGDQWNTAKKTSKRGTGLQGAKRGKPGTIMFPSKTSRCTVLLTLCACVGRSKMGD